jgi:ComF family protein
LNNPILNICLNFAHNLLPQNCLLCTAEAGRAALCPACIAELPLLSAPQCPVCAHPTLSGDICGACLAHPPAYLRTVAAYSYAFPLDQLVQTLKYHHQFAVVDILTGPLLANIKVSTGPLPDAVIAMPLHPNRLRQRGFNQSQQLARTIARQLKLPLFDHACRRDRDTPPQAALPFRERHKNIRNAFSCNDSVAGKRIAIVDDVMTSGSTLDSLARALLKAGALEVQCWVVARAIMK